MRGQQRLAQSRVAIVGCGALGTHQAVALVRAGVGELVIIDRDYVEESNLQRQCLFDEHDAVECIPKALAAENHLRASNSAVSVRGVVADFGAQNASQLLSGADLVLDGTDNFETRYLINDLSVRDAFPWIYGAAVGSYGVTMTIVPGSMVRSSSVQGSAPSRGPCLVCVFPEPPAGLQPTCDTEGILSAAASAVAAIQIAEALKLLVGDTDALHRKLITFDLWENRFQAVDPGPPDERCRACGRREFTFLKQLGSAPVRLCGRNSVQIHEDRGPVDFAELERRLKGLGSVRVNSFVMRFSVSGYEMTIFPDGRAIVKGTEDTVLACSLYERYVSPALAAGPK